MYKIREYCVDKTNLYSQRSNGAPEGPAKQFPKEELEAVLGEEHTWPEEEDSGESEEEIAEKKKYQKSF